jgi:hypothetical protein
MDLKFCIRGFFFILIMHLKNIYIQFQTVQNYFLGSGPNHPELFPDGYNKTVRNYFRTVITKPSRIINRSELFPNGFSKPSGITDGF